MQPTIAFLSGPGADVDSDRATIARNVNELRKSFSPEELRLILGVMWDGAVSAPRFGTGAALVIVPAVMGAVGAVAASTSALVKQISQAKSDRKAVVAAARVERLRLDAKAVSQKRLILAVAFFVIGGGIFYISKRKRGAV